MTAQSIQTILAVDCGTTFTKAVLISRENHTFRCTAHATQLSTAGHPWQDITLGIVDAIHALEQASGRRLLTAEGVPSSGHSREGVGVDAMTVVVSAAEPLQVLLAGLMADVSVQTARRAIATTYAAVENQFVFDGNTGGHPAAARITTLHRSRPDIVLLVGGIDGGAGEPIVDLAQVLAMGIGAMPMSLRPHVIYAGNTNLRAKLAEIFGKIADFKPVDNVVPALDRENLSGVRSELEILYQQHKISAVPGIKTLSGWLQHPIVSTGKSFGQTIHYLGQSYNIKVLGVDVGSAATTLAAVRHAVQQTIVRPAAGMGKSLSSLLTQVEIENIRRWLPADIPVAVLRNYLYNKSLSPQTIPQTAQETWLELAALREMLRVVAKQAKPVWGANARVNRLWLNWDLIIGAGLSLTALEPPLAALALLDGLEPAGICSLALDNNGLLGVLGSVALVEPLAAAQVAGYDALLKLGTVVAPVGRGRPGETALKLKIVYDAAAPVEAEIPFGALKIFPLDAGQQATLELHPGRNFSLYASGKLPGKGVAARIDGGRLGVIIDARGRPVFLPQDDEMRRQLIQSWLLSLNVSMPQSSSPIREHRDNDP